MKFKRILLDPGHGLNPKTGRYGRPLMLLKANAVDTVPASMKPHKNDYDEGFYREDFGTLKIAGHVKDKLVELGHSVFMTRNDNYNASYFLANELGGTKWQRDNWPSYRWITKAAKDWNCDIIVSIHTNAGGGSGLVGFYNAIPGNDLATSIINRINTKTGLKIRRVTKRGFMILRNICDNRACLVECGFHDNYNDLKYLLSPKGMKTIGVSIAEGIDKFTPPS